MFFTFDSKKRIDFKLSSQSVIKVLFITGNTSNASIADNARKASNAVLQVIKQVMQERLTYRLSSYLLSIAVIYTSNAIL